MRFEHLEVWKKACRVSKRVYKLSRSTKDWGFRDQITRSALSIASNIAEGEERGSLKENVRFLYYAKGSAAELITQTYIGIDIGYINKQEGFEIVAETKQIAAIISKLIKNKQDNIDK